MNTSEHRGGNGRNGNGTWPKTDSRGCPNCGAMRGGGHGGHCPNSGLVYDEMGPVGRTESWERAEEADGVVGNHAEDPGILKSALEPGSSR